MSTNTVSATEALDRHLGLRPAQAVPLAAFAVLDVVTTYYALYVTRYPFVETNHVAVALIDALGPAALPATYLLTGAVVCTSAAVVNRYTARSLRPLWWILLGWTASIVYFNVARLLAVAY